MENFVILKSKTVYHGRAFKVESIDAQLPDGNVRPFDLVRHKGAVTIVPVDEQGRIWFVRQYRLGADQPLLELPAGTLEVGEDPTVCASREIREEIGLAAGTIRKLGDFYMAPGYSTEFMHVFLATDLYPEKLQGDDDEFVETEAIPLTRVIEMVHNNLLKDGKSLAALLLALPFITAD